MHINFPTCGVLRFIWRGVLAFDRVGSRIPQLVQIWLVELFFAVPLMFFIAKAIDIRGAFGVPGTGESMPGVFWGALVVALVCGFFFFRSLIRPRVVHGSWTPMVHADVGSMTIYGGNRRWTTSYDYLTSHPSYSLLLLLTAPLPLTMVLMTINHGDSTFYWRVAGIVGLTILALMALARVLAWYVFRFGRRQVDNQAADKGMSQRKLGWEIAWKPVLMLMVMVYAIVCIPLGWMFWQQHRTIAALPDFVGVMKDVENGELKAQGKVIDSITEDQEEYYGFDESDFPEPSSDGRVMVLLSYP